MTITSPPIASTSPAAARAPTRSRRNAMASTVVATGARPGTISAPSVAGASVSPVRKSQL